MPAPFRRLRPSSLLDPLAELDDLRDAVSVTPDSYPDWGSVFAAHPDRYRFALWGDYSGLGALDSFTHGMPSGTAERRRLLVYGGPEADVHPARRSAENQAILRGLHFRANTSHWIARGLTFDLGGNTDQVMITMRPGSEDIVLDYCTVQGHYSGAIVCYASDCTVQRCVVRNAQKTPGVDTYGIMFAPQQGTPVLRGKALDCEVYNMVDMLAATVSSEPGDAFTEVGDIIHDGHDLYNEAAYYETGAVENITDFKTGSDTRRNYVRNCRLWGLGPGDSTVGGSGGSSHMMVFHRAARNWTVEDCILGENVATEHAAAYHESVWQLADTANQFGERGNIFRRNVVYSMRHALDCELDGQMLDNQVFDVEYLIHPASASGRQCLTDPVITGNRQLSVASTFDPSDPENPPYDPALNAAAPQLRFRYERKRWTGPEVKDVWVTA